MGLFDFFKSSKKEEVRSIVNSIGKFTFIEFDGTKNYKGLIDSKINNAIEVLFPVNENEISDYQTEYYKKIEVNWNLISNQLKEQDPQINIENYKVKNILIPEKNHKCYDMDAEIVLQDKSNIISIILKDLTVDEVIY